MKINRPSSTAADLRGPTGSWLTRFSVTWSRFWFEPRPAFSLHATRILTGLLLLLWLLPLAGQYHALFGLQGWIDREAYIETSRPEFQQNAPPTGWSLLYPIGMSPAALTAMYWFTITVFVLFTLGVFPRVMGILTWLLAVSHLANATSYEADYLLVMMAFYLMIAYIFVGQWSRPLNPAERILGMTEGTIFGLFTRRSSDVEASRSYAASLFMRVLQVHVAIIMLTSAVHKLQFGYWWSGVAFWFPLHPPFSTTADTLRASATVSNTYLFFLTIIQYAVLGWQLAFPLFAWRKSCRWLLLGGAALGWLGTVIVLQQPLFGPFFFIAFLCYLTPSEWQWIEQRLSPVRDTVAGWFRPQVERKAKAPART